MALVIKCVHNLPPHLSYVSTLPGIFRTQWTIPSGCGDSIFLNPESRDWEYGSGLESIFTNNTLSRHQCWTL